MPPPPPTVVKPIARWIWIVTALVVVAITVGLLAFIRQPPDQSHGSDTAVTAAVAALHARMTQADDAGIYADADQTYRDGVTEEGSKGVFERIRIRLGAPHSSRQTLSDFSDMGSMGNFLILNYRTAFDKGSGNEVICFRKLNGAWKLSAYNVDSPLLQPNKPAAH